MIPHQYSSRMGRLRAPEMLALLLGLLVLFPARLQAAQFLAGAGTVSITPDQPVALTGQMRTRIAREVESPVTATALAFESLEGDRSLARVVMVSCDLVAIREGLLEKVREAVGRRVEGLDPADIFLSATHTHTAPVLLEGRYEIPAEGVMQPAAYVDFFVDRVSQAVAEAWTSRAPATVGWGLGHAVVALNRRAVYGNGTAQMYGKTDKAEFRGLEGTEDHGVEVLFVWKADGQLLATGINVACPAQEVESRSALNADFWHPVREALRQRHGKDLHVLGWTGAAGDQSPHLMYRKAAEERMRRLRGVTRLEDISRRIVQAWDEAHEGARQDRHPNAVLRHESRTIELPLRQVTDEELAEARLRVRVLSKSPKEFRRVQWHQEVIDRHAAQHAGTAEPYRMELHVVRIGDVAIATNPFELFTDYGTQIKSRSRALQTFVIQLAGPGTYLPSQRAVEGGGYSAIIESNLVGPRGGQVLVDETVRSVNGLWSTQQ